MSLRETLAGAAQRAFNGIARGTLVKADDAHKWQELTVRAEYGDKYSGVEVAHPYGFTAVAKPPADDKTSEAAEVILVFPDGSRSHPIAIAIGDRRYRLQNLAEGEVALHDDLGQKVHLTRDGILVKTSKKVDVEADDKVTIKAPKIILEGIVYLGGEDANRPVSAIGTTTSDGASDVGDFLDQVFGK